MDGEQLINEMYARPPIWQTRHKHYRNRGVIEKLWEEIGQALKSTKDEARNKWKNMRDQYRKELKKSMQTKSGDAGGKKQQITWPFFELLYFLKEEMDPSQTSGNLELNFSQMTHTTPGKELLTEEEDCEPFQPQLQHGLNDTQGECSTFTSRSATPSSVSRPSSSLGGAPRKRKANTQDDIAKQMLELEEQKVELLKKDNLQQCEDYHFLMSLLPYFKEMSSLEKLQVRNKITQVFIDAKIAKSCTSRPLDTFNYSQEGHHW